MPVLYVHAPARNISIARNACLDAAEADWIAFIDDDEIASPSWLRALLQVAEGGDYDAVFGPVIAEYGADAPQWIRRRDYHSTWPEMRGGVVQTGYAGNVLLRWKGAPYQKERFLPEKGRTGGEDTEFFFRLWRKGARFGIAEDATVREAVDPGRLNFRWLSSRKFRAGQSYGRHAVASERHRQAGLAVAAATKVVACGAMALGAVFSMADRRYWALRGIFHCGVLAAQFGGREIALYGT